MLDELKTLRAEHRVAELYRYDQRSIADPTGNIDYDEDFGYRIARTPEDDRAAWRLRYRVYCEETGYLPKEENLDGFEFDEYDARAHQSLLIHRESGMLAGTVRLILPQHSGSGPELPAFQASKALSALSDEILPRATTAEISRFSVDPLFRRRMTDGLYPDQVAGAPQLDLHRAAPKMMLGLTVSLIDMSLEHELTHVCAVIDPALLRLMRRIGVHFTQVGAPVDFHGLRQPVYAEVGSIAASMCARHPLAMSHLA